MSHPLRDCGEQLRTLAILLAVIILAMTSAQAQIWVDATGSWSRPITSGDLQGNGGSNLTTSFASGASEILITVGGTLDTADAWEIQVRRSGGTWDPALTLSSRRTGDGTGGGSINGGGTYQDMTTTNTTFFSGAGDRANIPVQLRLSGVSATLNAISYSTSIIITVVDL